MNICVYGGAGTPSNANHLAAASLLGNLIAGHGHTLVFGGGANGMMGAVASGAHEKGGKIIGVAPSFFDRPGILYEYCSEFCYTVTMRERKSMLEDISDAFIALPGGIGTMDEFFEIITLRQLGIHSKPVALLNTDGYYDKLSGFLDSAAGEGFLDKNWRSLAFIAGSPAEIIGFIETSAREATD